MVKKEIDEAVMEVGKKKITIDDNYILTGFWGMWPNVYFLTYVAGAFIDRAPHIIEGL